MNFQFFHIYDHNQIKFYRHAADAACNRKATSETAGDDILKTMNKHYIWKQCSSNLLFLEAKSPVSGFS